MQYGQPRYSGTSLASPIFAGIVADAASKAGTRWGSSTRPCYGTGPEHPVGVVDIRSPGKQGIYRRDYASTYLGSGAQGFISSFRALSYLGPETYCDGTGECYSAAAAAASTAQATTA